MKSIIKLILCIFALIMSVFSISAITITSATFHAESSNTSLSVSTPINASNVIISSDYIYLEDFQFNKSKQFYVTPSNFINNSDTYDLTFSVENKSIDSVNMIHYFRFNNTETGSLLTNWTLESFTSLTQELPVFFNYFGLEGLKSWTWEKLGYATASLGFNFSYDTYNNITINVLKSRIIINLYDDSTKSLITNESFEMQLSGALGYIFNTTSSQFNISDGIAASSYVGLISSSNYETKEIYFTYTNQEVKELDVYFIPLNLSNLGFVTIEAYKADNTPARYESVYAKQWFADKSAFIKVQETKTGNDGTAELKIILEDKIYQFCLYTEELGETCTGDEIIKTTENGQTIPITEERRISTKTSLNSLISFSENITVITSNVTGFRNLQVYFDWVDLSGFNLEMCYNIYKDYQYTKELVESDCIVGSAGSFEQIYLLNSSYAYIVDIKAYVSGVPQNMYYNIFKSDNPSESVEGILKNKGMLGLGLVLYITVIMTIVALLKNPFHGVVVIFIGVLGATALFSSLMSPYALSALVTFCGMTSWGLRQIR